MHVVLILEVVIDENKINELNQCLTEEQNQNQGSTNLLP